MITRETDYAIRLVMALAGRQHRGEPTASLADVAREMDIPYRFLRKLVKRLVGAAILQSRRGKKGGVALARDPAAITLYDLVAATGPRGMELSPCVARPESCTRSALCRTLREFQVIQDKVDRHLKSVTVRDLSREASRKKSKK